MPPVCPSQACSPTSAHARDCCRRDRAPGRAAVTEVVFQPAMAKPRGLPRLKAMFTNWLDWTESAELPGGGPMIGGASEFDDKPGPVRDMLAGGQRTWIET